MIEPQVDLLKILQALPREASAAKRRNVLAKISEAFAEGSAFSPRHVQELGEALVQLLPSLVPEDRAFFARKIADSKNAPTYLVRSLASDLPEVAALVLAASPILVEEDLVRSIEKGDKKLFSAIARRPNLSTALQTRIVESGDPAALGALIENRTVALGQDLLAQLIIRARKDQAIAVRLAQRTDVPDAALADLFFVLGTDERIKLTDRLSRTPIAGPKAVDSDSRNEAEAVKAARARDGSGLVKALASGWKIAEPMVLRILQEPSGQALAVLCLGLGISRAAYSSLVILTRPDESEGSNRVAAMLSLFDRLAREGARHIALAWQQGTVQEAQVADTERQDLGKPPAPRWPMQQGASTRPAEPKSAPAKSGPPSRPTAAKLRQPRQSVPERAKGDPPATVGVTIGGNKNKGI